MRIRLVFVAVSALLTAGCGSSSNAIDTSGVTTITPDTLTVCSDVPYEPFEFEDNGTLKGIDVDMVKAVADDLDMKAEFKPTAFDGIFTAMNAKTCDMVASAVSITDERKKTMLFSNGYFEVNQALLVRSEEATTFANLQSLNGRKVGVQKGTTGESYVKTHAPGVSVTGFDKADDMTAALTAKTIDGIVTDQPALAVLQKDPARKVVQVFTDVQREEYGFAFPTTAAKLQIAVNESLAGIHSDGRSDAILAKYLGATPGGKL